MSIDYEKELLNLAHAYAQHTLPICVYGNDTKTIEEWVQKIITKNDIKTMVVRDAEKRPFEEQKVLARTVQKSDQKTRFIFITSRSPYELEKDGVICRELATELSVLPIEL